MRQRKVNENAVENTIAFLNNIKILNNDGHISNLNHLQQSWGISKSTLSVCKELGFIKGQKLTVEPNRINALQILEVLRQRASKRIDVALSPDFTTAIERLTNSMNTLSLQNEKSLKSPILSRALNQVEQKPGTLFSETDNKEAKKFELLKAVASGIYHGHNYHALRGGLIIDLNEIIIDATEDLYNKFFKVK